MQAAQVPNLLVSIEIKTDVNSKGHLPSSHKSLRWYPVADCEALDSKIRLHTLARIFPELGVLFPRILLQTGIHPRRDSSCGSDSTLLFIFSLFSGRCGSATATPYQRSLDSCTHNCRLMPAYATSR